MLTTTEMLFQRSGLQLRIYGTERFHNFAYERFAYLTSRKKIGGTDDKQLYHHMYSRVSSFKPTPFVSDRSSSSPAVGPLMHQGAAPVDLSLNINECRRLPAHFFYPSVDKLNTDYLKDS